MLLNDTAQVKLPLIGVSTKSNGPIYVNPQLSTGYAASRTDRISAGLAETALLLLHCKD